MFIDVNKNNDKDYLRLVNAVRATNKNVNQASQKQVVLNIGPLNHFDEGKPDFIKRLRKSFKPASTVLSNNFTKNSTILPHKVVY